MPRRTFGIVASVALVLTFAAVSVADEIVLIPNSTVKAAGGRIRGKIASESPAEVKIKPTVGGDQTVPVDQIASVSYDGAPATLALAETRANNGQLTDAADLFKKAAAEATGKPLIAGYAKYRRAEILADAAAASPAGAKEATTELEGYVKDYGTGRYVGPALESLIRIHLAAGDIAKAQDALTRFKAKLPGASDRVTILEARILARSDKLDAALASLDKAIAGAKDPARVRDAKLAKAEVLVAQKQYEPALAAVQEVIKESPPEAYEIQALAHNTLGDCYRAAGRPKDALTAYLQTDILFDKDKEQHAKALAMIEQLFREIKADARADENRDRLKQLYPQSPYLNRK